VSRAIDHLVLAVRDLDAAASFYERLGFQVGTRNRHPWGTENRIVQLNGSFLELIALGEGADTPPHGERVFSFGAFVRDYLTRHEGFAMLVLKSDDAQADTAAFATNGIGDFEPFHFGRKGVRPDGSETQVAFTLAFARDEAAPDAGFFTCQHHFPENFWSADAQRHTNGATGIASVAMVAENPTDHHIFLTAFTGQRDLHSSSFGVSAAVPGGEIEVLTPVALRAFYGEDWPGEPARLAGFVVSVPDLAQQASRLNAAGIPFREQVGRLIVPAIAAHGVAIAFAPLPV
jgi:catechol 2,3-dioxygenase-like lactoylglutathione lyase family enzyme